MNQETEIVYKCYFCCPGIDLTVVIFTQIVGGVDHLKAFFLSGGGFGCYGSSVQLNFVILATVRQFYYTDDVYPTISHVAGLIDNCVCDWRLYPPALISNQCPYKTKH